MLGKRRNERAVLRGEYAQIGGAVGRLRGLVVGLEDGRRELVQPLPVGREPLTEAGGTRLRSSVASQTRLEHRLRKTQFGRDAEALIDRAPLLQEASISLCIRQQEVAARRVLQH